MKTIIAGGREIISMGVLNAAIHASKFQISEVVCGGARGADALGKRWAEGQEVPVKMFPADWDTHGKSAGYKRNAEMAEYADALIALWDGESKGTRHMIELARKKGLLVHVQLQEDWI